VGRRRVELVKKRAAENVCAACKPGEGGKKEK